LLVFAAATYRDAPQNGFHFDDSRNIYRHSPVMVTELALPNVLNAGRNALIPTRPLPSMTFAIDWVRGGGSARPFQLTNIALHGATTVAVFYLLFLLLSRFRHSPWISVMAAFMGAAMWACHPIQVQAVTYIVQRMASMAALFTLLTVIFYILGRQATRPSRRWLLFGLGLLCWMLGMASKETAAIAPFLVLLVEYGVLRHGGSLVTNKADVALLSLPAAVGFLIVIDIVSGFGPLSKVFLSAYELRDFSLAERLLTQPRVIGLHLSQIVWPLPGRFSLAHDFALSTGLLQPPTTLLALLGVIAWCGVGLNLLFRRGRRIVGFFLLWVPATLLIESSFIALEMVFEHRMYLPSVGLAGLVALALCWVLRNLPRLTPVVLTACALVIALLMLSTGRYVPVWKDDLSLAQHMVESSPNSARAWSALAFALYGQGQGWERVAPAASRALAIDPGNTVALNLRAMQLIENRQLDAAEKMVDVLAMKGSGDHSVINTIGMMRLARGNPQAAIVEFRRAVALNPFEPVFIYNLALSYELAGRCAEALEAWSSFLRLENDAERVAVVRNRLQRNFATEGGRCFDSQN
jgi:hypothetical protein